MSPNPVEIFFEFELDPDPHQSSLPTLIKWCSVHFNKPISYKFFHVYGALMYFLQLFEIAGSKHKMARFFPVEGVIIASVYAPIMFPPANVLMFVEGKFFKKFLAQINKFC